MPIVANDLKYKYSVAAAAGNTTAGTAAGSLGDQVSTTEIPDATTQNLFDNVSAAEATAGRTEYRCLFVHNAHATITLTAPVVWLSNEVASGSTYAVAVDGTAASAIASGLPQAAAVGSDTTAPAGTGGFSSPTTKGTGLALGDIPAGQCKAVWVRQTTGAGTGALANDGCTIRVEGTTTA